jgi:hypothetical protein
MAQQGILLRMPMYVRVSSHVCILQCNFYTQAGSSIRQAILKEQEGYPSPPVCLVYDVSIRNVFDYEQSSNQIKVQ